MVRVKRETRWKWARRAAEESKTRGNKTEEEDSRAMWIEKSEQIDKMSGLWMKGKLETGATFQFQWKQIRADSVIFPVWHCMVYVYPISLPLNITVLFIKSGGGVYIREGSGRPYTVGTGRCELSITPCPLDTSTETAWKPQLRITLQKQR